ncbi:glycosyltransferase family 2 protein [Scytonema sp. PCC 10023]|uniref:glycosyltransferase family 2 protein n=1 Tax=Scytonema sp. PCC 10023 TaxID=1680591 RepID=UPI0039C60DAC
MQQLVSIGMPVFNCEKTLISAVKSILNQTYSNWELILIDDGSNDKTLEIAKSFQDSRIKVIADGLNQQLPSRLNQAIAMSRGKYFARMDGDDISYPQRLQVQVEYLEKHPYIDLLGTGTMIFHSNGEARGKSLVKQSHAEICYHPWRGFGMTHPTWMGKIEWFRKYQYQPQAIRIEDQEILLRSYRNSRFACIPDILYGYRVESLSLKKSLSSRYYHSLFLMQKALAEKRFVFAYGMLQQIPKALVDIFAVATGLDFKILRHRAGIPVETAELIQWRQVWNQLNNDLTSSEMSPSYQYS